MKSKFAIFLLAAIVASGIIAQDLSLGAAEVLSSDYEQSQTLNSLITLYWKMRDNMIEIALKSTCEGYVGFGIGNTMASADMIITSSIGGEIRPRDYFSVARATPQLDTTSNILNYSFSNIEGVWHIKFLRYTTQTDGTSQDKPINAGATNIMYGCNASPTLVKHTSKGQKTITFYEDASKTPQLASPTPGANTRSRSPTPIPDDNTEVPEYTGSQDVLGGNIKISWILNEGNQKNAQGGYLDFFLECKGTGWCAIGFGATAGMKGADIKMGYVDNGVAKVLDMHADGNNAPDLDTDIGGTDDVTVLNGKEKDGKTTISFRVPLKSQDSKDFDYSASLSSANIIFAMQKSSDNPGDKHDRDLRSYGTISLQSGKIIEDDGLTVQEAHGILMTISWGFLIPLAITISRFFKHIGHLWYHLHVLFMSAAVVCVLVAFVLIVSFVEDDFNQSDRAARAHGIIGLVVFILLFLQPAIGFYADYLWSPSRNSTPFWPDKVHWYLGRIVFALSIAAVLTGISYWEGGAKWFAPYLAVLGGWILFWIVQTYRNSKKSSTPYNHT